MYKSGQYNMANKYYDNASVLFEIEYEEMMRWTNRYDFENIDTLDVEYEEMMRWTNRYDFENIDTLDVDENGNAMMLVLLPISEYFRLKQDMIDEYEVDKMIDDYREMNNMKTKED